MSHLSTEYHLTCMSVKRQWVAMFAPWRSQKSVRKHKDPTTCNSFIDVSQHVDRVLLYTSADTQLLCWLLVSVDTRSTDAFSTRNRLFLTTYPRAKIWSRTEPEDGHVPDRLPFIEPDIDTTWAGQKNCPGFQLMSQKMLPFFRGHERPDKANRSRARAGQEPDNAEYLYTF